MRKTTLVSDSKRKSMSNFGHSDHPKLKLSGDHMADYQFYHGSASESNPRSNSHQRKLNAMRNRLISGGVDKRKAGRMKKLADFPMPKSFKRTTTKIPSIKTYNPDNPEHESVAYHPDIGRDMRLLVLGKKKKK
jgi:hypothetical protein